MSEPKTEYRTESIERPDYMRLAADLARAQADIRSALNSISDVRGELHTAYKRESGNDTP